MNVESGVAAAILAGGRARRFHGANKAALDVGGERIIDRQLRLLRTVAYPVFVVANRLDGFAGLQVDVIPDAIPDAGPLGGIYTTLLASPAPRTIIVGCDMPFLTGMLLRALAVPSSADVVIARGATGYEPLCATWAAACLPVVERRIRAGALKAAGVLEEVRVQELGPEILTACDPHGLLFVNVNTPHDHERARRLSRVESNLSGDRIMDDSRHR